MSSKPICILMIDDDEEDFLIVRDMVRDIEGSSIDIQWSGSYEKGLKAMGARRYDVFLIDYQLGANSGLDLIRQAQKSYRLNQPLILLSGQNNHQIDAQALELGVSDYLSKGAFTAAELDRCIRYNLEHARILREIRQLNADLEDKVRERTSTVEKAMEELRHSQQELRKALEKEKELGEMKTRFITTASHEFRTPLSTILSSATLIGKYTRAEEQDIREKHIQRIKSSVYGLKDILEDFLSLGKLEESHIETKASVLSLPEVLEELRGEMQHLAKEGQRLTYDHSGPSEVLLDKSLLRNVMMNLISNAIKFSGEGTLIRLRSQVTSYDIELSVSDQGIGISAEDQQNLFERFFRGKNAINIQGSGLGLHIVQRYLELMHGSIRLESTLNQGTVFHIHIPHEKDTPD